MQLVKFALKDLSIIESESLMSHTTQEAPTPIGRAGHHDILDFGRDASYFRGRKANQSRTGRGDGALEVKQGT